MSRACAAGGRDNVTVVVVDIESADPVDDVPGDRVTDTRKGLRPSFTPAAEPAEAERLYDYFTECVRRETGHVATGRFGADMRVSLCNDGPVTFLLEG